MKLSVHFSPVGLSSNVIAGRPVLVVDILRASTTIVTALANGGRAVLPAASAEDALRLAQNLERNDVLLAGERRMEKIPGFALGNSPLEMTPEMVGSKTLVMVTTNGTPALLAAEAGRPVIVGAAVNFSAAAQAAARAFEEAGELTILCAGREKQFALEDAYAAGRFAQAIVPGKLWRRLEMNDAAIAARELVRRYGTEWISAVNAGAAARELKSLGFRADLKAAAEVDRYDVVPILSDRRVTLSERG
jgi:2-phosphosulfolactate phosphatase